MSVARRAENTFPIVTGLPSTARLARWRGWKIDASPSVATVFPSSVVDSRLKRGRLAIAIAAVDQAGLQRVGAGVSCTGGTSRPLASSEQCFTGASPYMARFRLLIALASLLEPSTCSAIAV
jgi:hypothetical protein